MRWLLSLLWNPVSALDMGGRDGRPSHKKIVGLFGFLAMYVLILLGKLPSVGHTVALLAAVFGWAMYRSYLDAHKP